MAVELSAEADRDLADVIASGLDRYGLSASDKYVARLREAFEMIGTFPRIARARDEIDGVCAASLLACTSSSIRSMT